MYGGDDIGGVEERLAVSGQQHEAAHGRHRRPGDGTDDGEPHEEVPGKALDRPRQEDDPGPAGKSEAAAGDGCGCVEEAGEDSGVGADVLEDGDGVERGLVVALAGLEDGGVDAEGVRCAAAALNPYARRCRDPFAAFHFSSRLGSDLAPLRNSSQILLNTALVTLSFLQLIFYFFISKKRGNIMSVTSKRLLISSEEVHY